MSEWRLAQSFAVGRPNMVA